MLAPGRRSLLLDALRPPEGYRLDRAVGAFFSLDLHALLLPPLAFALFDWAADEEGDPNPLALLEALRRNAERMTVFCQAGQIALPRTYRSLLVYLESCVVEAVPADPDRIFHPKVWALKFVGNSEPPFYRLVCLSRNLTFDRSWDTVLSLDGLQAASDRAAVRRRNGPLQGFLAALPGMAVTAMDDEARERLDALAAEFATVDFTPPEGFDEIAFHPRGIGAQEPPFAGADRLLVVSPFLTAGALARLSASANGHVLVSRQESLDAVGADALTGFEQVFTLAPHAWQELAAEEAGPPTSSRLTGPLDEAVGEAADVELDGLHVKLYVTQRRSDVRVFTGSANATDAAVGGNVEFLVELPTRSWRTSIDTLLEPGGPEGAFRDLLEPYRASGDAPEPESPSRSLERLLDRARRRVGACRFTASLTAEGDDYVLTLRGAAEAPLLLEGVTVALCWPVSLGAGHAVTASVRDDGLDAGFGRVSPESVTAFFAFELAAEVEGVRDTVRFAVNATVHGGPEDRWERVLTDLLRSRSDVLRYLLFLLADGGVEMQAVADTLMEDGVGGERRQATGWEVPLFEALVRSLATDPGRLDHLAKVVDDILRSGRGDELLPDGLDGIWQPIWQARQELRP